MKPLILKVHGQGKSLREKVYRETLDFISEKTPGAELYTFTDNASLLNYLFNNPKAVVVSTDEIPKDTALLLKGMGIVHILIGMSEEFNKISDIIIDPLLKLSKTQLVGTRYLLSSIVKRYGANEFTEIMEIDAEVLCEEVNVNDAEAELIEVVSLCQKLEWDSKFYGVNIGYITCLRLTPNIEKQIAFFIRNEKIDLLEYLSNCHDREAVITAEKNGYSFVDIRLTFEKTLINEKDSAMRQGFHVAKGTEKDISALIDIASDIYKDSRYYFDSNFNRKKVIEFYASWVEKAIKGTFDDYAYVLYDQEKPVGFCTIKEKRTRAAKIGLVGVSNLYAGEGLGETLINATLNKLKKEKKMGHVEVVTQGRNYAAQRLYQRCGFLTKTTELWYHKWFR